MCVTINREVTAYDQPIITGSDAIDVVAGSTTINIIPNSVESFGGGVAPVVVFMGSAAIEGIEYCIISGIQTIDPSDCDNSNVIHLVLRKRD